MAASRDFPLQGLTLSVRFNDHLAIECPPQCSLKVLAGRAWVTVDGAWRDLIAEPLDTIALAADTRTNVSALYDVATVMVVVPGHFHDAAFALREEGGVRVLSVTTGRSPARDLARQLGAKAAGIAGRLLLAGTNKRNKSAHTPTHA